MNGTPGIGIVVPAENKTFGVKGVSNSTLTGRQWGFAPRLGVAWSPMKNVVVRAGFGMFYDRGEYFTELSASAGLGISGPFSVTTQEPFTVPLNADCGAASPTCSTGCTTSELPVQCAIRDDASRSADILLAAYGGARTKHAADVRMQPGDRSRACNSRICPIATSIPVRQRFPSCLAATTPRTSCHTRKTGAWTSSGSRKTIWF